MPDTAPVRFCPTCMARIAADEQACSCGFVRPRSGWPADEYLGRTINDKYRIVELLGEGGFAIVHRARQIQAGVDLGNVVLKFLHPNLARRPSVRRRFIDEARAARALGSPHVVKVFDLGFDDRGQPFLVMEYLEGQTLGTLLKRGPLEPARALRLGLQIAGALRECHAAGVIHRDLKPANIILLAGRRRDFAKLLDFGIARLPDSVQSQTVVGTPKYMPPEQILHDEADGGVDVFALGVLLFECFAGEGPISADHPKAYLERNLTGEPRPLRELAPDLPGSLERLLAKMIAKDRLARPSTMGEVEARLASLGIEQGWITRNDVSVVQAAPSEPTATRPMPCPPAELLVEEASSTSRGESALPLAGPPSAEQAMAAAQTVERPLCPRDPPTMPAVPQAMRAVETLESVEIETVGDVAEPPTLPPIAGHSAELAPPAHRKHRRGLVVVLALLVLLLGSAAVFLYVSGIGWQEPEAPRGTRNASSVAPLAAPRTAPLAGVSADAGAGRLDGAPELEIAATPDASAVVADLGSTPAVTGQRTHRRSRSHRKPRRKPRRRKKPAGEEFGRVPGL